MEITPPASGRRTAELRLDPRTKLLIVLVVSWTLLSAPSPAGPAAGAGTAARWALIALPCVLFLACGLVAAGLRYAASYLVMTGVPQLVWHLTTGSTGSGNGAVLGTLLAWLGGLSLILPGLTCCWYALRTTTASEFIAAMQRLHCPDALTVPVAIIFRFFPTIGEEYRDIRTAMRMRGISGLRNPVAMLEYRFVPLLVSVVGIGNELSMSAVTRALGSGRRRTTICTIGFRAVDGVVIGLLIACLAAIVLSAGAAA
jgi:energy-coupling factor transport system permease protein